MVLKGPCAPENREKVFSKVAMFLLLAIMFERFAYYSITGSLTIFFTRELGMSNVTASQRQSLFQALVFIMPTVGGVLADTLLGRYRVAMFGAILASVGATLLSVAAYPTIKTDWLVLFALYVPFAIGAAPVKPTMIVLGGDQFNELNAKHVTDRKKFFDFVYLFTNIGALVAFLVMATMVGQGMGAITLEYSFFVTFCVGAFFYICACGCIVSGSKNYWVQDSQGSVLAVFASATQAGLKGGQKSGYITITALCLLAASVIGSIVGFFVDSKPLQYTLAVLIVVASLLLSTFGGDCDWVLDAFKSPKLGSSFTKQQVVGTQDVYKISPYIALCIPFWAVYNQMNTNFISQGCQMNDHDFMSPSTMNTFNSLFCITGVFVVKGLSACLKNSWPLTNNRRIAIGHVLAAIGVAICGIVEIARKKSPTRMVPCEQEALDMGQCTQQEFNDGTMVPKYSVCIAPETVNGVDVYPKVYQSEMSIFVQIPQNFMIGTAEIFVAATYYDVFYAEVLPGLRTVCQTTNMLIVSLGTLVGAVINTVFSMWVPNDLNTGKMENVQFVLCGLAVAAFIGHVFVSKKYVPRDQRPTMKYSDDETSEDSTSSSDDTAPVAKAEYTDSPSDSDSSQRK